MIINDEQNENDRIGDQGRRDRISTVSEMVTHEQAMARNGMPSNVSNLSITKSSHVHFGPKFVNVTVEDTEGIKEVPIQNYLWKYCKQTTRAERLSCAGVVVALIVCVALIIYFTIKAQAAADIIDDPAPHEWNITRDMWIAKPVEYDQNSTTLLYQPVHLVVIQHSVSAECHQFITCAAEVRNIQAYYLAFKKYDIPYNFLVGNDGRVYEGRGWGIGGAHTAGYNLCSVGIGFIGDYREEGNTRSKVTAAQVRSVQLLLDYGVSEGYLSPDYWVAGAKDLQSSESPGTNLYNEIRTWQRYDSKHQFQNRTCAQIYAKFADKN